MTVSLGMGRLYNEGGCFVLHPEHTKLAHIHSTVTLRIWRVSSGFGMAKRCHAFHSLNPRTPMTVPPFCWRSQWVSYDLKMLFG